MLRYLITSDDYYPSFIKNQITALDEFREKLTFALSKKVNMISFRFNNINNANFYPLLKISIEFCEINNIVLLINLYEDMERVLSDFKNHNIGLHLKGEFLEKIAYFKEQSSFIIYSAHSLKEMERALELGANFVTISPIFYDKFNKALGLDFLKNLPSDISSKAIALGGISNEDRVKDILKLNIAGFASIRYFLN